MQHFILWYIILTILGFLTFPIAFHLLSGLSDRGYALSRIIGLLLWGYIYWLFGCLGFLQNNIGGLLIAILVVCIAAGLAIKRSGWVRIWGWVRGEWKTIVFIEVLFLFAFLFWAFIRSTNPEIIGTEKPMELAFINSVLRSPTFPPNDPWLSGYAISYYYFGYVLVGMVAKLAGTPGSIAFNLGISMIFALSALGSYSILFNLLRHKSQVTTEKQKPKVLEKVRFQALLSPFFILIVSNMGGVLHILRLAGIFWTRAASGQWASRLWSWLDMGRYATPPPSDAFPHWWWWQASRLVQDFDYTWVNKGDIIDEFPFFSFILGDLHPHVLAMPFAFLAISLTLNLLLGGFAGQIRKLGIKLKIRLDAFLFSTLVLGSLAFFNTWDFPFYVALFAGAYVIREVLPAYLMEPQDEKPIVWKILGKFIMLGIILGLGGAILFLPFYFTFQSQAGGPLPNLIFVTRGVYLWLHFLPLLVPILGYILYLWNNNRGWGRLKTGIRITLTLVGLLYLFSLFLTLMIANIHILERVNPQAAIAADAFLGSMAAPGWVPLILEGLTRRLTIPGTLLTIVFILIFTTTMLWPQTGKEKSINSPTRLPLNPLQSFLMLLVLIGTLLVLAPEFIYLRDLFGYRINTIFKFYYQVWLLWGIASSYGLIHLWSFLTGPRKKVFQAVVVVVLCLSLTYPLMAIWSKTNGLDPSSGYSLDGTAYVQVNNPEEYAAMEWLKEAPLGVVAEAVGGSYTQFARMSSNSGQPTVLGWDFHELQWRGGTEETGSRRVDIELLYCTSQWEQAQAIINQYNIRYVVVGTMEYSAYGAGSNICPQGLNEIKFVRNLPLAFQQGGVSIYLVPEELENY